MMTPRPDHFTYPANKARDGQIVLTKPWMRIVFFGGLLGCVALTCALAISAVL